MNNRENNAQEQQRLGQLKNLVMLAIADEHTTAHIADFLTSDTSKFGLMLVITFQDQTYRK